MITLVVIETDPRSALARSQRSVLLGIAEAHRDLNPNEISDSERGVRARCTASQMRSSLLLNSPVKRFSRGA